MVLFNLTNNIVVYILPLNKQKGEVLKMKVFNKCMLLLGVFVSVFGLLLLAELYGDPRTFHDVKLYGYHQRVSVFTKHRMIRLGGIPGQTEIFENSQRGIQKRLLVAAAKPSGVVAIKNATGEERELFKQFYPKQ